MKIKFLFTAITFIVLAALSAAGFFVYKNYLANPEDKVTENTTPLSGSEVPSEFLEQNIAKETRLLKDGFEITLPFGWQEATSTYEGFLLLAFDAKEDISGGDFQKLDFRTNLSIKSDDLSKYSTLDTLEKYVESMKSSLILAVPGISFVQEEPKTINGARAISIECLSRQKEADFKTKIVFVQGNDHTVYALSFNAFQSSWEKYKSAFEQITQSFKVKYKVGI